MVEGEWECKIVSTNEKNGPSGIYNKHIYLPPFGIDEDVTLAIMHGTASGFWKKKQTDP
jgi:hypothetical protein